MHSTAILIGTQNHYRHLFSVLVAVVQEAYPLSFSTAVKKSCQIYLLKVRVSCVSVAGLV